MTDQVERIYIFATIRPKPEHFEEAKLALEDLIKPTLDEPGCHLFTVLENADQPGCLHLFEIFEDEGAIAAHYAQEYTQKVFASYEAWLAEPVAIEHLSATSPLSSAQFGK